MACRLSKAVNLHTEAHAWTMYDVLGVWDRVCPLLACQVNVWGILSSITHPMCIWVCVLAPLSKPRNIWWSGGAHSLLPFNLIEFIWPMCSLWGTEQAQTNSAGVSTIEFSWNFIFRALKNSSNLRKKTAETLNCPQNRWIGSEFW